MKLPHFRAVLVRLLTCLALLAVLPAAAAAQTAPVDVTSKPLVYVFVFDGLDGDRVDQGRAPFLSSLLAGENGARSTYYRESRALMVAETNPNHTAMATGAYGNSSGIPGNSFAVYSPTANRDSCAPTGPINLSTAPTVVSGENANCVNAETVFQAAESQPNPQEITTAGIFGKPKLGRIFASRTVDGNKSFDADFLFAPCEGSGGPGPESGDSSSGGGSGNPSYCRPIPTNPATGTARDDAVVMDEVLRTVREGVPADGQTKRPNLTFVNFPTIDQVGHGFGAGPAYDQAIAMADAQLRRFVDQQKQLGLWQRTVMVALSDHSMDTTPEKFSLDQRFRAAGISSSSYRIVQNGSAALVYLTDRASPDRFTLLKRLREAAIGPSGVMRLPGVMEALYREDNPADGGATNTIGGVHPEWRIAGDRTGDLLVSADTASAFSDPINPLAGNHGGPQTRDNFFAVIGGDLVRQQTLNGQPGPGCTDAQAGSCDDTAQNPGQAENVDVSATVMELLGRAAPANRDPASRMLSEAFVSQDPGGDPVSRAIRLTVSPTRATVGRRTRFRFTATTAGEGSELPPRIDCSARACRSQAGATPVSGARVRFAGRTARTDSQGRVTITAKLRRVGRFTARATKSGLDPGSTAVRAVRRKRGGGGGQNGRGPRGRSGCEDQRNSQFRSERDRQRCKRIGVAR